MRAFCQDGRKFIYCAVDKLLSLASTGQNSDSHSILSRLTRNGVVTPTTQIFPLPLTPSHFVMNLPATAIEFCDSFSGLYAGHDKLFQPYTERALPMVHVHCFSTKSKDNMRESIEICDRISRVMKTSIRPRLTAGALEEGEARIWDVREVAPKKRMFCAEFQIPSEVAFRVREAL